MRLEVLDSLTDPAKPGVENEDRIGWNETAAFVIDGATGLGDPVVAPPLSDAAWLAEHARRFLQDHLVPKRGIDEVVGALCAIAQDTFFTAAGTAEIERYRYPNAAFQVLRLNDGAIETAGLADCTLILRSGTGAVERYARVNRDGEQRAAKRALARDGGFNAAGESFRGPETLEELRAKRARLNSDPAGMWTLGVVPEASRHLDFERLPRIPLPAVGLLCTDGFADLVDHYHACTEAELIARAEAEGLQALLKELRHIERVVDPDGIRFPRYKRCDDASAILVKLSG